MQSQVNEIGDLQVTQLNSLQIFFSLYIFAQRLLGKPVDLQIISQSKKYDKQTDVLHRAFNFGLVFILELVLVAHHQVGVRHTQLEGDNISSEIIANLRVTKDKFQLQGKAYSPY